MTDHNDEITRSHRLSDSDERLPFNVPFTNFEARRFGVTPAELRTMVRTGVLRRVHTGVYVDSAVPDSQLVRTQALAKILPSSAVVTDESAGWVHMVDLDPPSARWVAPPITVFRTGGGTRVRKSGTAGGQRGLLDRDVEVINGVRVTSPLRTACDLGRLRSRDRAFAAMNALVHSGKVESDHLLNEVERFRRMRGVVQLRELAPMVDGRADSPAESIVRLRCWDHGIPPLTPQLKVVRRRSGEVAYLDLADERLRFAVEFDGREWHEGPDAMARDRHRRGWLVDEEGWFIVVLGGSDVYGVPREHTANVVRRGLDAHLRRAG
jgi:hypothetical protein